MFACEFTNVDDTKTTTYRGWFTLAEVKRNLKKWTAEYDHVYLRTAQVSVLTLASEEQHHE